MNEGVISCVEKDCDDRRPVVNEGGGSGTYNCSVPGDAEDDSKCYFYLNENNSDDDKYECHSQCFFDTHETEDNGVLKCIADHHSKGKSMSWWWLILLILGVVILIVVVCIILIIMYKKKKKKKEDGREENEGEVKFP
jgi:hypothetical protein